MLLSKRPITIVTTEPSMFVAQFHNRMPLFLETNTLGRMVAGRCRHRRFAVEAGE